MSHVIVAGLGVSGPPVVAALLGQGHKVTVVDDRDDDKVQSRATEIRGLGAHVQLGSHEIDSDVSLVITSPGWKPTHPLLASAQQRGIEVIGDIEFAWRLDQARSQREGTAAPQWLAMTGTNGKTTTVGMLASMLQVAGKRSVAAGNVGHSMVTAVLAEPRYEVIAVELSSFQLHWSSTLRVTAGAVINVAEDHLDWHGTFAAYSAAKEKLLHFSNIAIVNHDDEVSARLAQTHPHRVGVTRDIPRPQEVGVVEDFLVDRAFSDPAMELATFADITPFAPHNITNSLIAAALARAIDLPAPAIAAGLRAYHSDGHRIETIAEVDGVRFVDDSKATNPHAAKAALESFSRVIWIAGGLAKGASMDELVEQTHSRVKAAILIGTDRGLIAEALTRHAPNIRVEFVDPTDTNHVGESVMTVAVRLAKSLADPGDVVLLAPACASMDQFTSYAERGDLFAAAVKS